MMEGVVDSGTATKARIEGYHVGGKTGTAQKVEDGKYSNSKYYASFIGFFPSDDPILVCGIVIDEPAFGLHHGGTAAAPAVKNTFVRIINTPDFNRHYPVLSKTLAKAKDRTDQNKPQILSILNKPQKPEASPLVSTSAIQDEKTVKSGDYDIVMPNVVGLHVLNAKQKLQAIGLEVILNRDRGKVDYQSPDPGTFLKEGSTCILEVRS
jgi:membrane peptidoglycan carboxypeptidase